ncbi:glycerol acyltransferase [Bacteroidia bacterium]|nr:glycerol acyltransferase [Bacteroidia bacterium]
MERIDVEQLLASKSPALAKRLPKFVLRYLKRIIHQDEINDILHHCGHLQGLDFVAKSLKQLDITYTLHGEEHLADTQRKLFLSNHPLGGFDGVVLLDILGKHNPAIKTVINDLLMNITPLQSLFLPVNKHGVQSQAYAQQLQAAYSSNDPILYFPAGLCSRKIKGKIVDLEWKKSAVKIARDYQRDVVPIYFAGRNSNFFYWLANVRKRLKIKMNIEMLYLADELFKQRNTHYHVFVGNPISHTFLSQMKNLNEMTDFVRQKVYELPVIID